MGNLARFKDIKSLAEDYDSAVKAFLDYSASKNLSEKTLDYYHYSLLPFTRFLNEQYPGVTPDVITPVIVREAIVWQMRRTSPQTANHTLVLVKRLFNFLCSEGYLEKNPAEAIEKLRMQKKVIETLSPEQIQSLLDECRGRGFLDCRDRAIFLV
ncbi:MAG TPA: site-specific integrase, partial [Armatimonadota bacterium]